VATSPVNDILLQCPKPVIAVVHGACIGGGIDMITATDIRIASKDAYFQIKVNTMRTTLTYMLI